MIDEMALQTFLAYAVVSLAFIWIVRRVYRTLRVAMSANPSSVPTSCSGCPGKTSSAQGPKVKTLVQIGSSKPANKV